MKKLIITAHPASKWLTHALSDAYIQWSEKAGHETFLMNLYDHEWKQEYLEFERMRDLPKDHIRDAIQEKITWADEIMFIFPIWWYDSPAVMKNWYDMNITSGFAYKYHGKPLPTPLLKWKTARIITTAWWPSRFYKILMPVKKIWKGRLSFTGIKLNYFKVFGSIEKSKEERINKILEQITKLWAK